MPERDTQGRKSPEAVRTMLIDQYDQYVPEDVFARVPELAGQTDPVLKQLDRVLEDDGLYQAGCAGCATCGGEAAHGRA
jgi:hypothetical protein